jgi:DNA-binding NarL/FixJ family response regulator
LLLSAIPKFLSEEPRVKVIAKASSFAETMQAIADFKPDVLLLDLHLPEKRNFAPEFVKSQISFVPCVLAVSFADDSAAKALADSYVTRQNESS